MLQHQSMLANDSKGAPTLILSPIVHGHASKEL